MPNVHANKQDIRAVLRGLYELKLSLNKLFADKRGSIFITNMELTSPDQCYCLVVEDHFIELIEKSDVQKIVTKWDVNTGNIYVDNVRQNPSFIMDFVIKINTVISDLKSEKARMYQNT